MNRLILRITCLLVTFLLGMATVLWLKQTPNLEKDKPKLDLISTTTTTNNIKLLDPITDQNHTSIKKLVDIVKQLKQFKVDSGDTNIPVEVKPLLTELKHSLETLIEQTLNKHYGKYTNVEIIKTQILKEITDQGIEFSSWPDSIQYNDYIDNGFVYGQISGVDVKRPKGTMDNYLAITTNIDVCCGQDTSLYLFKNENKSWKLILAQESNNYDTVAGAQSRYQYRISEIWNDLFIATVNANAWCSSNWHDLRYKVIRPGKNPYQPEVIFEKTEFAFIEDSDLADAIELNKNTLTLRFYGDCYSEKILAGNEDANCDSLPDGQSVVKYSIVGSNITKLSK